jgi:hypothetical protein
MAATLAKKPKIEDSNPNYELIRMLNGFLCFYLLIKLLETFKFFLNIFKEIADYERFYNNQFYKYNAYMKVINSINKLKRKITTENQIKGLVCQLIYYRVYLSNYFCYIMIFILN